uniref:Putative Hsc70-interacting protein (Hip) n=1 Tax=Trypanosoma congolense (strain IL3000) TaxID=1068625 RepID=G0UKJ0_TRYCI|nr:putative Hsc70-interacting protein (Hip) [Trypanosoma congolense IL3000]
MVTLAPDDFRVLSRILEHLRAHPSELHRDEFNDFRAYLTSLGATLPPRPAQKGTTEVCEEDTESEMDEERWELEDVPVDDIPIPTGEPSADQEEQAMQLKAAAADRASEGLVSEAVDLLAEALRLVPGKAIYWSQRASYLLECKRPGAALRDANRALRINPENVRALRVRGTVNRHLGKWEEALKDLNEAQAVDYDERIEGLLRLVREKVSNRRNRRRQKEEERQEALRQQRERELQEEQSHQSNSADGGMPGGFPGGTPGGFPGGMPGGFPGGMPGGMAEALKDPEIMAALQDPEIAPKLTALMQNPMAAMQMLGDPKMGPVLQKIMAKVMGRGFPGAGMGGQGPQHFPEQEEKTGEPNVSSRSCDDLD